MSLHDVVCTGPHASGPVVVASVELPDNTPPDRLAAVLSGWLCGDCGDVYRVAVATRGHPHGVPPSADLVNDLLPGLRAPSYWPASPPPPPSWAPSSKPWAYPPRPSNVAPPT